ncbi:hypothetical protein BDV96DRAFT_647654 [Lophiotrema nucula]|uniref:BTB domain-containing protein n=1 Tax=Lophiotrema nucula TaxID=690887 RepID=A0A6A5Z502_9PLEO|nr:hypothetical protein BDV96DRAFT_647654 [Lophiotrema nucula]
MDSGFHSHGFHTNGVCIRGFPPLIPLMSHFQPPQPQPGEEGFQLPSAIVSHLGGYFANGQYSDLQVKYDRDRKLVSVHKIILCTQSKWFSKALGGQFQESKQNTIALHDDYPASVECMFEYMYTGSYENIYSKAQQINSQLSQFDLDIHAYAAGDKYDIPALRDQAIACYINRAQHLWMQNIAYEGPESPRRSHILFEYERFLNSVTLLYAKTPTASDPMRRATIGLIKHYFGKLSGVKFFSTMLAYHDEFRCDMEASLADDGIQLSVVTREGSWREKDAKLRFTNGARQPGALVAEGREDSRSMAMQTPPMWDDSDNVDNHGDKVNDLGSTVEDIGIMFEDGVESMVGVESTYDGVDSTDDGAIYTEL